MLARIQVCLSFDFDAMSLWIANFQTDSPNALSRGEFGGRVGAPRLLDLLRERGIRSTWFIPGHTVEAFPEVCRRIAAEGHEIGHHGYCHENPRKLDRDQEVAVIERGIRCIESITGVRRAATAARPAASRSARSSCCTSYGFLYDSSMMADDFTPYYCRVGDQSPPDGAVRVRQEHRPGRDPVLLEPRRLPVLRVHRQPARHQPGPGGPAAGALGVVGRVRVPAPQARERRLHAHHASAGDRPRPPHPDARGADRPHRGGRRRRVHDDGRGRDRWRERNPLRH